MNAYIRGAINLFPSLPTFPSSLLGVPSLPLSFPFPTLSLYPPPPFSFSLKINTKIKVGNCENYNGFKGHNYNGLCKGIYKVLLSNWVFGSSPVHPIFTIMYVPYANNFVL